MNDEHKLDDHEKRIIRLEECYKHMSTTLESFKIEQSTRFGRLERAIDQLRSELKPVTEMSIGSRAIIQTVMSIASPVVVALVVYALLR